MMSLDESIKHAEEVASEQERKEAMIRENVKRNQKKEGEKNDES